MKPPLRGKEDAMPEHEKPYRPATKNDVTIIHHNDLDGRCAAAIAARAERSWAGQVEIRFREMDYKDPPPLQDCVGRHVCILDFSFKPNDMKQVLARAASVVWCDHHKTAAGYPFQDLPGVRDFADKGDAGCECTWRHYRGRQSPPTAVSLIGDYDAWRLRLVPKSLQFYEGMKLRDTHPGLSLWDDLLISYGAASTALPTIIDQGRTAMTYRDHYCGDIARYYGYESTIGGHNAFAMNAYRFGSPGFGERFRQYPVCIAYIHDGAQFTVSLYSETVDVGAIAKALGGGGHTGAAGFVCKELPFRPTEEEHNG